MTKIRRNITIPTELDDYIRKEADTLGINYSAMVTVCLKQYQQGIQALNALDKFQSVIKNIKEGASDERC